MESHIIFSLSYNIYTYIFFFEFMSIKSWPMWAKTPKVGSIKTLRIQLEVQEGSSNKMTFTERKVELPVWIILHPLHNWLSVGIARHYIHVSATFLSSRCRVDGYLLDRIFPVFSSKSISPQYFTISERTKMDGKIVGTTPTEITRLHLHFISPFRAVPVTITHWR